MKKSRIVLLLLISVLLVCFSIGCKSEPSTAKPQATNYTVTFNANGGSGTMPAQTFAKDETKALSANTFTMTNKVFTGWNTKADGTGTSYTDGQSYTATGNITLYAQWTDEAFVVTFDKNDGSGDKVTQPFAAGIPQNLKANTFTIADKIFTGWNTKADGTGTPYTDGQSYTATADITLYAQWRDPYIYTVTFDKNDGSTPSTTEMQYFTEGQAQNFTTQKDLFDFPDGMKFVSWNTEADGTGTTYTDGESYTATADITLYAQWDFAYLCFTAEEPNSTVKLSKTGTFTISLPTLECSTDGLSWEPFVVDTTTVTLSGVGDKFYLRGDNNTFSESNNRYLKFIMTGKIAASGNIMSLLDKTCRLESLDGKSYCFKYLFYLCSSLTKAPELPATTVAQDCYNSMFHTCTSLTKAPELPAMTLADYCYVLMFAGCTSLIEAPELPAMTLKNSCYDGMFYDCISLTEAPKLPTTTLVNYCYRFMFTGCTSLSEAPELPATTLWGNCYENMFAGCTSLTEAPELPATTLSGYCYAHMFEGCTSLMEAPELPVTTLRGYCYASMFAGCTSLTEAPELPATTLVEGCYTSMFNGCTSLTEAPELPATILARACYTSMFNGCTSLTEAPELSATTLEDICYKNMFYGCTSLCKIKVHFDSWSAECTTDWMRGVKDSGTFICPSTLPQETGVDKIPAGWRIETL